MRSRVLVLVLCAMFMLTGCLTDPTAKRLLDSVQRLSDTLATELENIRKEPKPSTVEPEHVGRFLTWQDHPCVKEGHCVEYGSVRIEFGAQLSSNGILDPWIKRGTPSSSPLTSTPFGEHGCDDACAYGPWLQVVADLETELARARRERAEDEETIRKFEEEWDPYVIMRKIAVLEAEIAALEAEIAALNPMTPEEHEHLAVLETRRAEKWDELEFLHLADPVPPMHRWTLEQIGLIEVEIVSYHAEAHERREQLTIRPIWNGYIEGLTPTGRHVSGTARLQVDLDTLAGDLAFQGLHDARAGGTWNDGDLDYKVKVNGNSFVRTSGDAGTIDGRFYGNLHQVMGGTLVRDDLAAGFGGKR